MSKLRLKKIQVDALHAELCNQGYTPYIIVYVEVEGVVLPEGYANEEGLITLDISAKAVTNFRATESELTYNASFGKVPYSVSIPYAAIIAICPKEDLGMSVNLGLLTMEPKTVGKPIKSWADSAYIVEK